MFRLPAHRALPPNSRLFFLSSSCPFFSSTRSCLFSQQPQPPQQQPQYQAPDQTTALPATTTEKSNPHRDIYKPGGMGRPVARNFLIAMLTFQLLYWAWLKLESVEVKLEKREELSRLEREVEVLTGFKGKEGEK